MSRNEKEFKNFDKEMNPLQQKQLEKIQNLQREIEIYKGTHKGLPSYCDLENQIKNQNDLIQKLKDEVRMHFFCYGWEKPAYLKHLLDKFFGERFLIYDKEDGSYPEEKKS